VRSYRKWIATAGIGPVFRHFYNQTMGTRAITSQVVADIVTRSAMLPSSIMKQTGHRSVAMVRTYIHDAELFSDNAVAKLGL
jgi:hypothetical protein